MNDIHFLSLLPWFLFLLDKIRMSMMPTLFQVGFNPLRVLRKRNNALGKIKQMLQKKDLDFAEVRF